MKIRPDTLYLIDNGACYCGEHLPATARYTGRDISGQPITPVTRSLVATAHEMGYTVPELDLACERPDCGRTVKAA